MRLEINIEIEAAFFKITLDSLLDERFNRGVAPQFM